jgi:hypothetical protein
MLRTFRVEESTPKAADKATWRPGCIVAWQGDVTFRDGVLDFVLRKVGVGDWTGGRVLPEVFPLDTIWRAAFMCVALCFAPLSARAGWSVADASETDGCVLETEETSLFDGYQDTRLRLRVTGEGLLVRTESNIDFGFDDVGLAVDGEDFIPADAVTDEKDVLFSSEAEAVIGQFIRGRSVTVYLRFWPSYPATQRYEARFSLMGFTRAYNDYQACRGKPPA